MEYLISLAHRAIESIVRNVSAEAWFYIALGSCLIATMIVNYHRGIRPATQHLKKSVGVDCIYAAIELSHIAQLLFIFPLSAIIIGTFRTHLPQFTFDSSQHLSGWAQLLILFIANDFIAYWWHRCQHSSSFIWQFHKTHHSQKHLTVFTTFRMTVIDRMVALFALSLPSAVMQTNAILPTILLLALTIHQFLIHSDTGIRFGPLEKLFVSPSFHEVHHSTLPEHLDKNFGAVLSIWDAMFSTKADRGSKTLIYGLHNETIPESFFLQQFVPIFGIAKKLKDLFSKGASSANF